jgi:hypothetical protein
LELEAGLFVVRVNQDDELTSVKEAKALYRYGRIAEITFASWKDRGTLDESSQAPIVASQGLDQDKQS